MAGSGTISSAGIGSGLDVSSIISQLMTVEKAPLTKLQTAAAGLQTKLSAFGQMQSLVSAFRDATAPLYNADNFSLTSSTTTDPASVGVSSTTKAVPGAYSVSVSTLAATQTTVSATGQFSTSADAAGTGSITIRLGTWAASQTSFTPKTGSSDITVPIGASENTLAGIRDKINAANAGVSATIVTDANGARLSLQSTATGAANGFRVTVADDDGNNTDNLGLSRLAFDPPSATNGMSITQSAANTQATINGIAVTSTGNTLSDVVEGMTFTVNKVTASPVTVNVSRNTDALKTMLTSFVAAYNALNQFLNEATKYDAASKKSALLQGDATTVGIQGQLRGKIGEAGLASSTFGSLSSIGLEFQKDGSLKLNDTKVTAALKNLPELKKALSNVDTANANNNGFAKKLATWADGLLASSGTLPSRTQSIQKSITANQKDQDKMSDRLVLIEQRLRAQYTTLDTAMSQANALQKYVSQQITTWNNSGKDS